MGLSHANMLFASDIYLEPRLTWQSVCQCLVRRILLVLYPVLGFMCRRREIPQTERLNRNSFPTVPVVLESKTKTEAEQGSLGGMALYSAASQSMLPWPQGHKE